MKFNDRTAEILTESKHAVEISVRDAGKAQDIANDVVRGEYKQRGSNVYEFKDEDVYYWFIENLDAQKIKYNEL